MKYCRACKKRTVTTACPACLQAEVKLLRADVEFYRRSLKMIEHCRIETGGFPMSPGSENLWLRELAHEALTGIDPTTGKHRTGPSGGTSHGD